MSVTIDNAAPNQGEEAATEELESRRSILRRAGALSAGLFAVLASRGERADAHPGQGSPGCCQLWNSGAPGRPNVWCQGDTSLAYPFTCDHGGVKRTWFCQGTYHYWGCGECISGSATCWDGPDWPCSYAWIADGGGCFVAGTSVATPQGERAIEELNVGDEVLAWDLTRRELVPTAVTEFQRHEGEDAREVLELTGEHGTVRVTPEHRFFDGLQWTPAAELTHALHVKLKQLVPEGYEAESRIAPLYARMLDGSHDVYNIHVAHPDHNYIAAGYVVHNVKPGPIRALSALWAK